MILRKLTALSMAAVLCLGICGCEKEPEPTAPLPSREDKPIMDFETTAPQVREDYTPVYVSVFGDTAYLAKIPIELLGEEEPECDIREISLGGPILCGGEHEKEEPIVRVVITEELGPTSTADWFRGMTALEHIEGAGKLRMELVEDMSHMFAGCGRLSELSADGWEVPADVDMTGIFDGCDALAQKPDWYEERS